MPYATITAIIVIGILLGIATWRGIDGVLLSSGLVIIAGLGGWAAHKVKKS